MTVDFHAPTGETPIAHVPVPGPWALHPRFRFGFLVTSQAVYLPVKRGGFHLQEDLQPIRVPVQDISQVVFSRERFVTGMLLLYGVFSALYTLIGFALHSPGSSWLASFWLLATVLPQFLLSLLGSARRLRLTIHTAAGPLTYAPAPEIAWVPHCRRRARQSQLAFIEACRRLGITVLDSTTPSPLPREPNPGVQRTRFARR